MIAVAMAFKRSLYWLSIIGLLVFPLNAALGHQQGCKDDWIKTEPNGVGVCVSMDQSGNRVVLEGVNQDGSVRSSGKITFFDDNGPIRFWHFGKGSGISFVDGHFPWATSREDEADYAIEFRNCLSGSCENNTQDSCFEISYGGWVKVILTAKRNVSLMYLDVFYNMVRRANNDILSMCDTAHISPNVIIIKVFQDGASGVSQECSWYSYRELGCAISEPKYNPFYGYMLQTVKRERDRIAREHREELARQREIVAAREKARREAEAQRRREELEARKIVVTREWERQIDSILASDEPVENIADLIDLRRDKFIDIFFEGRSIIVPAVEKNFRNGNIYISWNSRQTDIYSGLDQVQENNFSWDKWFKLTQGIGGQKSFQVTCEVDGSYASSMREGAGSIMFAKLISLGDRDVVFKCIPQ